MARGILKPAGASRAEGGATGIWRALSHRGKVRPLSDERVEAANRSLTVAAPNLLPEYCAPFG